MVPSTMRALSAGSGSENHRVARPSEVQASSSAWPRTASLNGRTRNRKPSTMPASAPPGPVMNMPSIGPWLASGVSNIGPKKPATPPTAPRLSAQKPGDLRTFMAECSAAGPIAAAKCFTVSPAARKIHASMHIKGA
jgi:hypothetical protein